MPAILAYTLYALVFAHGSGPAPQSAALTRPEAAIAIGELICANPGEITVTYSTR